MPGPQVLLPQQRGHSFPGGYTPTQVGEGGGQEPGPSPGLCCHLWGPLGHGAEGPSAIGPQASGEGAHVLLAMVQERKGLPAGGRGDLRGGSVPATGSLSTTFHRAVQQVGAELG